MLHSALLGDLDEISIAEHKGLIDAVTEGKLKPGSVLERPVELAALYDETWKLLIPGVAGDHAAVVEVEPTTGRASRLSLKGRDPSKDTVDVRRRWLGRRGTAGDVWA
jgi:hypothetical protein